MEAALSQHMNKTLTFAFSLLATVGCGTSQSNNDDALRVEISFQDGGPIIGDNTVVATIVDASSRAMDAEVSIHLHMPAHGHSEDAPPIVVTRLETGKYSFSPVRFTMPGEWEVHVRCSCPMGEGETEQTFSVN